MYARAHASAYCSSEILFTFEKWKKNILIIYAPHTYARAHASAYCLIFILWNLFYVR